VRLRRHALSEVQERSLVELAHIVARHGGFGPEMTCPTPLDTAKGLVRLVNELPNWVLRTSTLPPVAIDVRNLAKTANDPNKFLLDDLPAALSGEKRADESTLASLVNEGLETLLAAYPKLLADLEEVMLRELRIRGRSKAVFADLRDRAGVVRNLTGNYRLDAFATRLAAYELSGSNSESIEGIASLAVGKPARDWVDRDVDQARIEIATLAQDFVKAEGFGHVKGRVDGRLNVAIYTSDWRREAPVRAEADVSATDDAKVADLVRRVRAIFKQEGVERDVVLAVVAELGAFAAAPLGSASSPKRKTA
jgi:hypothetical protein